MTAFFGFLARPFTRQDSRESLSLLKKSSLKKSLASYTGRTCDIEYPLGFILPPVGEKSFDLKIGRVIDGLQCTFFFLNPLDLSRNTEINSNLLAYIFS